MIRVCTKMLKFFHIKARAVFIGKFSVAVDCSIWELFQKCKNNLKIFIGK